MEYDYFTMATYQDVIWKEGCQLQRVLRCELNAVYFLAEHFIEREKYDKAEKSIECLQVLEHPRAYTMSGLLYEQIANDYRVEAEKLLADNKEMLIAKTKEYQDKALEVLKIAYERQEKEIDFYYGMYLANYGNKEEAIKVLERISNDKANKNHKLAKRYLKREKTRASFIGKFSISANGFWDKILIHLIYLFLTGYLIFKGSGWGFLLLIYFIVVKIRGSKISKPKWDFDFKRMQIGGDKIYETSKFDDLAPFKEDYLVSETYRGAMKVNETYDEFAFQGAYTVFICNVISDTDKIREKKKEGFIQRAELGDKRAIEALKYFYGLYYEDGNITEGEILLGLTQDYLTKLARRIAKEEAYFGA